MSTTIVPFQPKGAEAEWRPLYRAAKKLKAGDVLPYEQITEDLGRELGTDRAPMYRAIRELERVDHRTMECVAGVGYRVVEAAEHMRIAKHHQKKSRRQLGKSLRKVRSADRRKLSKEQADQFDAYEQRLSRMESMVRRLNERQSITEERTEKVEQDSAELAAQVARLHEQLQRRGLLDDASEVQAA